MEKTGCDDKIFQKKSKSAFKFGPFLDIFGGVDKRAKTPYDTFQIYTFSEKNITENDVKYSYQRLLINE
jgi:hypothetical protein